MAPRRQERLGLLGSVGPGVVFLGAFFAFPLVLMLRESLIGAGKLTLSNYHAVVTPFNVATGEASLVIGLVVTALTIVIGFPVAAYYVRASKRMRSWVMVLVVSPLFINLVVSVYGWMTLLETTGGINRILETLGWIGQPLHLMYNDIGVIIGMTQVFLPFMILSQISSLENIDHSLYEAANLLGAPDLRVFRTITLPLAKPGLVAGSTLVFALVEGAFITPSLLGGNSVQMIALQVYSDILVLFNWPQGTALAVLLALLIVVLLTLQRLLMRESPRRAR